MAFERKFIKENIKRVLIKEFLLRRTQDAGFGGVTIQRTPLGTRVTLVVERPGMVIGRHGGLIKQLTETLEGKYELDNPQVEVLEARNPNINAQIMAQKLAFALERGWHFRRGGHSTVRRIMESGAKGCQVTLAGKLTGQRHRTEKFKQGHIKFCGEPALQWMQNGYAVAKKKSGVIGVTVRIMDPKAVLPDEIKILAPGREPVEGAPEGDDKADGPAPEDAPAGAEASKKTEGKAPAKEPAPKKEPKKEAPAPEPVKAEEPAPEPEKKPEPKEEPAPESEPAKEPAKAEEPKAEPEPVEEPAEGKAEEPKAEPEPVEEPAEEKAEEPKAEPEPAEEPVEEPAAELEQTDEAPEQPTEEPAAEGSGSTDDNEKKPEKGDVSMEDKDVSVESEGDTQPEP